MAGYSTVYKRRMIKEELSALLILIAFMIAISLLSSYSPHGYRNSERLAPRDRGGSASCRTRHQSNPSKHVVR